MLSISSKSRIIVPLSLVFMFYSNQLNASCSRDDVEFYLGKGFTTSQITQLCAVSSDCNREASKIASQNGSNVTASSESDDDELYLKVAIKANDIYLSAGSLHYTNKICIEYGEEDIFGFSAKLCPDVRFMITLRGLEVLKTGKQHFFYGVDEVGVRAAIKREIIGGLDEQHEDVRQLVFKNLEQGNETNIPVREDMSLQRVKGILKKFAK